jgi:hypothetical protein
VVDMTFLREQNLINVQEADPGGAWKRHYEVELELVMIVNNRNLRYEARWPAGGQVRGGEQISIAAAFRPGTE